MGVSNSDRTDVANVAADEVATETPFDSVDDKTLRLKIDLRLCTIAGLLCSLNLLDSSIISSASVTSIFQDLDLGIGNRYSVSIFIFTVGSFFCSHS